MAQAGSANQQSDRGNDEIWVFESNTAGKNIQGAAAIAIKRHGAQEDISKGPSGGSYALLTRDADGALLPWKDIQDHVKEFRTFAESHADLKFRILPSDTAKTDQEHNRFADLLRNLPTNCELPGRVQEILGKLKTVRVILLDANISIVDTDARKRALDQYFSANVGLWNAEHIEIVSIGAAQSLIANDKYAKEHGYGHRIINVDADIYGDDAEDVRELVSVAYATKLLCLNDPDATSTAKQVNAIRVAGWAGLEVDGALIK